MRRLLALALAACIPAYAATTVAVTDAWVRGTVPSQDTTGAFMTLTSTEDAKLVGVSTPIAKIAEVHETMNHGGMMHMEPVPSLALPRGKPVALQSRVRLPPAKPTLAALAMGGAVAVGGAIWINLRRRNASA